MLNRKSEQDKKTKDDKTTRILRKAARDIMVSGDDVFDTLKTLQSLKQVQDRSNMCIAGLERLVIKYEDDKGTFFKEPIGTGYDAVFRFGVTEYRNHYLKDDKPNGVELTSFTGDKVDVDDFTRIWEVREALEALPKRYYVQKELNRIVSYIENDNAIKGLANIKEVLGKDASFIYDTIMAKEDDTLPDYSMVAKMMP